MKKHNKLVRDYIPEILSLNNIESVFYKCDNPEYAERLRSKLQEEVNEYLKSGNIEELADVLEVVYALARSQECSKGELEEIRRKKSSAHGAFNERLILVETKEHKC